VAGRYRGVDLVQDAFEERTQSWRSGFRWFAQQHGVVGSASRVRGLPREREESTRALRVRWCWTGWTGVRVCDSQQQGRRAGSITLIIIIILLLLFLVVIVVAVVLCSVYIATSTAERTAIAATSDQ
jgi:hypothetical protein